MFSGCMYMCVCSAHTHNELHGREGELAPWFTSFHFCASFINISLDLSKCAPCIVPTIIIICLIRIIYLIVLELNDSASPMLACT